MNIIFQIDGGLGKSIMATAVIKAIKKKYKKSNLYVVSAYTDVFLNNPHVKQTYRSDQINGFYLKYIKDKKAKVFFEDPYRNTNFITEEQHLLQTWCEIYGLEYNGESPELYLTQPEVDYYSPFYKTDKPIFVMQPNGGPQNQGFNYSWTRDLPETLVLDLINHYKDKYSICHVRRKDQKEYQGVLNAFDGFRSIAILLQLSQKRLFIDSFGQHLAAAMNKPSVVGWVTTNPGVFGYGLHTNIIRNSFKRNPLIEQAAYQPFNLAQDISSFPYNDLKEVFDTQKFIDAIDQL
tara:strand:- start:287 stop:1162 length:876 start_codon:yes stop_codon:yes gene_type:complete